MGNASILRMARLLRLSRMARMARLLRAMPELLILIKGMVAAIRSVFFTLALLMLVLYVYAIAFVQLTGGTQVGFTYFNTVPEAMHTLLLDGAFMDGLGERAKQLLEEGLVYLFLFYSFVLVASLTVLNMLIGVLCEVISAVASTEKERLNISFVKEKLQEVMSQMGLDQDGDGRISKKEFLAILENSEASKALSEVDVDVIGIVDFADFIFEGNDDDDEEEDNSLSFEDFMEVVLELRGSNGATVKDVVNLRKFISTRIHSFEEKLHISRRSSTHSSNLTGSTSRPSRTVDPPLHPSGSASEGQRAGNTLLQNAVVAKKPIPPTGSPHDLGIHTQKKCGMPGFGNSLRKFQQGRAVHLERVLRTGAGELQAFVQSLGAATSFELSAKADNTQSCKEFRITPLSPPSSGSTSASEAVELSEVQGQMEDLLSELQAGLESLSKFREQLIPTFALRNGMVSQQGRR